MTLINLSPKQPQKQKTDLWLPKQMGHGGGIEWEFGIQFSHSVVSDSLQPHGLQHTRLPCPSPTPGAY